MSATSKDHAAGTRVYVLDGTWRQVMGIKNIPGFGMQSDDIDATELDPYAGVSTTPTTYNLIKKTVAGWIDLGELSLEAFMTADEFADLLGFQLAGTDLYFRIDLRSGYSIGLYGHVKGLNFSAPQAELVQAPVTIKLTERIRFGTTAALTHVSTGWGV